MKNIMLIATLLLLSSSAMAGVQHQACIEEEKILRQKEKDQCGGMVYFFNPSSCYATRKALAPFNNGKCAAVAKFEKIQPEVKKAPPEQNEPLPFAVPQQKMQSEPLPLTVPQQKAPVEQPKQASEFEILKTEIDALKAEIQRLNAEVERLKSR